MFVCYSVEVSNFNVLWPPVPRPAAGHADNGVTGDTRLGYFIFIPCMAPVPGLVAEQNMASSSEIAILS